MRVAGKNTDMTYDASDGEDAEADAGGADSTHGAYTFFRLFRSLQIQQHSQQLHVQVS